MSGRSLVRSNRVKLAVKPRIEIWGTYLPTYSGSVPEFMGKPLDAILADVQAGKLRVPLGPTVHLSDIVVAHRWMEQNTAGGKIVIRVP